MPLTLSGLILLSYLVFMFTCIRITWELPSNWTSEVSFKKFYRKISLTSEFKARNLLDLDVLSKSDPVCFIYALDQRTGKQLEVGRTEQIQNNLNPNWNKKFVLDYRFEERQILRFAIYDWDGSSNQLKHHDFLGSLDCSLGEIVAGAGRKFIRSLNIPKHPKHQNSTIEIVAVELNGSKEVIHLKMNGRKLDKKDFFGKSDPYLLVFKEIGDGCFTQVHKTEIVKNSLNPDWRLFTLRVASLTGGKVEGKVRFQVWDWDSDVSSDLIGQCDLVYMEILEAARQNQASFPLINPTKKGKKKSYLNSGLLNIDWLRIEEEKTFLDYIQSGVQLHFTVAVDFTASNGDPNNPQSLHYRNPHSDNQYVLAIKSVALPRLVQIIENKEIAIANCNYLTTIGYSNILPSHLVSQREVIQDYDSDKSFPALGFGGRIPPIGVVSHEFSLNGNPQSPFCQGIQGILDAYYHSLNTVQLYGPTYFAPVINHVAKFASSYQDGKNYFILLIITDGIICDLDATKDAIISASALPMSIIIIGVGSEDFSAMEFLDSDDKVLSNNGRIAGRDIVQFVEMRKFHAGQQMYNPTASTVEQPMHLSKVELARSVLAELPDQLVLWMKKLKPVV